MRARERSSGRAAALAIATAASALIIVGFAAGPAEAKSDITVSAVPVATSGSSVPNRIEVTASGADDGGGYQKLCVARQIGRAAWHKLTCAPVTFAAGGVVKMYLPLAGTGVEHFRARLFRVGSAAGSHPVLDLTSQVVEVNDATAANTANTANSRSGAGGAATPLPGTWYFWPSVITALTVL